ncbi:MAG TPA: chemotaxis protein CheD [bacterium]|nr:chemotaxis protein CheD [bacterium]
MPNIIVDIASMAVSPHPDDVLITYALGSCLGIVLYDPVVRVGGLAHIMLPDSSLENGSVTFNRLKYIDTGVPLLFKEMYRYKAQKYRIRNAIIGGARFMEQDSYFNIGERNIAALRKLFWRNNVLIDKKHIGDRINRTIRLEVSTGNIYVKESTENTILL